MPSLGEWDVATYRAIHEGWKSTTLDVLMTMITTTGLGWVQLILLLPPLIKPPTRRIGVVLLVTGLFAGGTRLVLMQLIGRLRPSNLDFSTPMEDVFGRSSFPSGHTTTAFALATALYFALPPDKRRWSGFAIVWAILVGLSRIYLGVHFPTDVIAGAFFGIACACAVFLVGRRFLAIGQQNGDNADNTFAEP